MKRFLLLFCVCMILFGTRITARYITATNDYYYGLNIECNCVDGCLDDYSCVEGGCLVGWSGPYCQREALILQADNAEESCVKVESEDQSSYWRIHPHKGRLGVIEFTVPTSGEDLAGLKIYVGSKLCFEDHFNSEFPLYNTISCNQQMAGNTIIFSVPLTSDPNLEICNVKAYDCYDGFFGQNCENRCNCWSSYETCDTVTGQCPTGCAVGFYEPDCQTPCEAGYTGYDCQNECGQCLEGTCDGKSGLCDGPCKPQFVGRYCDVCLDHFYGEDCTIKCGHCLDGEPCDPDGMCFNGCAAGYHGFNCKDECSPYTYGPDCQKECGNCSDNKPCDRLTGECIEGCETGYTGALCLPQKTFNLKNKKDVVGERFWTNTNTTLVVVCLVMTVFLVLASISIVINRRKIVRADKTGTENDGFEHLPPDINGYESDDSHDDVKDTDISISELKAYIDRRMARDEFIREYRKLPNGLHGSHLSASMRDNKSKNRFMSIYPYDHSRVKLSTEDGSDYINASYIDGYDKRRKYIATQGPMPSTNDDFWRMVWNEKCGKIVMLTNILENAKIKCHQYWPAETDSKVTSKNLEISLEKTVRRSNYVHRVFKILNTKNKEERTILHFHYVTWPDHGVPSAPSLISFWKAVKRTPDTIPGPMVVHCSAGVGRTGTFLGLDSLLQEAKENDKVDIFKCTSLMRGDRVNMIQTREQYVFLHYVVHEAYIALNTLYTLEELKKGGDSVVPANIIKQQFENTELLKKQLSVTKTQAARAKENKLKNRSASFVPHDSHRVFLVTTVDGRNDYIMAYMVPSLYKRDGFILTQLPMESTVVDFWRMVYEYNSLTIVSLVSKPSEEDGISSPNYWPQNMDSKIDVGPFVVRFKNRVTENAFFNHSVLELEKSDAPDPTLRSSVHMLSVTDWPVDKLVPERKGMLDLIVAMETRLKDEGRHTVIIQDFDGATKCNLYCAVVNCLNRLKEDDVLDVFLTVREIQTIQPNCFETQKEYAFCYEMAKEYIDAMIS